MFSDETCPYGVGPSMCKKLASTPLSWRMRYPLRLPVRPMLRRRPASGRRARRRASAMHAAMSYTKGLHELGDGCFAYLQPDGGWGWSNAGLLVGDGQSLLVDTLFDLRLTAEMLDAMAPHTAAAPISHLVNTHANGDHCYGNQLVAGAEIIASTAAAEEMGEVPPCPAGRARTTPRARSASCSASSSAPFDFDGIELTPPTRTFDGRLDLEVGGRDGRADRGRSGPHQGRRARARARPTARSSPATSCSSAARRSCGPGRCPTGSPRAT